MPVGPTPEEMFTLAVKDLYSSFKDLPSPVYQIQRSCRDEARPQAGLLRGREFVMKDCYSFDVDDAGLEASYELHRSACIRIFDRLGFDYVIVAAMSGAMGGSAPWRPSRPPRTARTPRAVHALRLRRERRGRAGAGPRRGPYDAAPTAHVEDTPDTPTIETLVRRLDEASHRRTVPGPPATP